MRTIFALLVLLTLGCGGGPPVLELVYDVPDGVASSDPDPFVTILTRRLEALEGGAEVARQGQQVRILLFDADDAAAARDIASRQGVLSLVWVDEPATAACAQQGCEGGAPNLTGYGPEKVLVLAPEPVITNAHVLDATTQEDSYSGESQVVLTFTGPGAQRFSDATGAHVGERLAIVVDGRVISAPEVRERIPGGKAVITMGPSAAQGEAEAIAAALDGGVLPAPITLSSEGVPTLP